VPEYQVPALVRLADGESLATVVYEKARSHPADVVFSRRTDNGWQDVTYREFADLVYGLAKGLLAAGIEAGQRVLIFGPTSYEWSAVDFALLSVGAITVPVYPTASTEQVRHIVADSGATAGFLATPAQRDLVVDVAGEAVAEHCWLLGSSFDELLGRGAAISEETAAHRRREVVADEVATIVYTSGTTGLPKGCLLTHRNIFAAAANVVALLDTVFRGTPEDAAATLLFLPLAHVYGRVTQFGCVWAGVRTGLVASAADLLGELPAFRPTFLVGVPYLLEKIRKVAGQAGGSGPAGARYEAAEAAAIEYGRALRHGTEIDAATLAAHAGFDSDVYQRLRAMLGGRLAYVIAGGASLEPSTADFFAGLGVTVLGAYGLTEASSTVSMSAPEANRADAVGRPVPGTTVAIADDGEILVRGEQVFTGYWPDGSGAAEHWLPTGDLGRLDEDGFLYITGRRKEIIVTSGGKNVVPAPLEDRVRLHPLVSNCMVVGEGRPYVTALITVDPAALARWAERDGVALGVADWTDDPRLRKEIQSAVDAANELVSQAESIRRFLVLPEDFSIELGQVTASLRLRRNVIEERFGDAIATLYT
jgi:long-chain acyl-CoA synthetase